MREFGLVIVVVVVIALCTSEHALMEKQHPKGALALKACTCKQDDNNNNTQSQPQ